MGPGAPLGNKNGSKNRPWREALDRALAQYETEQIKAGQALRAIADRVVGLAIAGDKEAYKEIAYRLDGPIAQDINLGVDSAAVEGLSIFGEFLAQAITGAKSTDTQAVDTGGSVLPVEVRTTTH